MTVSKNTQSTTAQSTLLPHSPHYYRTVHTTTAQSTLLLHSPHYSTQPPVLMLSADPFLDPTNWPPTPSWIPQTGHRSRPGSHERPPIPSWIPRITTDPILDPKNDHRSLPGSHKRPPIPLLDPTNDHAVPQPRFHGMLSPSAEGSSPA